MLRFGTSGIPRSSVRPGTVAGIARARELGLDHLEMAWVNGVRMSDESADRIAEASRTHDVSLTAHAPYYVNLCGEPEVVERSLARLIETGRLGSRCGARSYCFHAGFYGKLGEREAGTRVRRGLRAVTAALRRLDARIDVRTELTGKASQAGSLDEVLAWSAAVPGVQPCVDFSHQYARGLGKHNHYDDFAATLVSIGERLGRAALERLHVHISGIQYGPKGERRHEPLRETSFRWRELLRALKDLRVSGWVVSESPAMEDDALLLQKTYRRLK
ncbi:MAG: TIM barrel protein [Candidatus Eisenbacteria bacterium]|nr:TIM barrel protein [Candidatus Eisenbacteria bacterium]